MLLPRHLLGALVVLAVLAQGMVGAAADATAATKPARVILAFLPASEEPPEGFIQTPVSILDRLDERRALALGLSGATQGTYKRVQAFLDIGQGTRTSLAAYHPRLPPELEFYPQDGGALFQRWLETKDRAESAPADVLPGLLAESVPGGAAYVGVNGRSQLEAIPAADRAGRIGVVSIGPASDVADRARRALDVKRFVVVGLPTGEPGGLALNELIASHEPRDLLIVMQTPPDLRASQLLPTGALGLGTPGALTSDTTRLQGMVAGIDIFPTVLEHLGVPVPRSVKGQPIRVEGDRDAAALQTLTDRLRVVGSRRVPALQIMLVVWLAVVLAGGVLADRRGVRWGLRVGALAFFWLLTVLLITGAMAPGRTDELVLIAALSFTLAIITDRLVAWPRAPMVPGFVTVLAYVVDLARGSDLIIRSLLGPNPRSGSRFYGIGNELESTLPLLLFVALAALLWRRGRTRETAAAFGVASLLLGAALGSGRLGADVGGVITVGAGAAVCVVLLLPGRLSRRRIAVVIAAPAVALVGLTVLDLATGGNGHFTRTVLRAEGGGAIEDIIVRRYELAFGVLRRGAMPFITGIALLAVAYGVRHRARVYAPLEGDEVWRAALLGGLAAAVAGALFNDSGPLLLIFGVFVLALATAYVRGDPRLVVAEGPFAPSGRPEEGRPQTE
ncbi:hypothetical protein [Paraconexibacter sp.]|uniref:hypothetical protein n=1 Tax=Paraconexibacter sp. TaxID=2949640 RepID=UPI00356A48A1